MIKSGSDLTEESAVPLAAHERDSALKRLAQIAVALGHPQRTAAQTAALQRERAELQRLLAAGESHTQAST